jgi:hypothetical protein
MPGNQAAAFLCTRSLPEIMLTTAGRASLLHPLQAQQQPKASAQVLYPKTKRKLPRQKGDPSCSRLLYLHPLFLVQVLLLAVQHREGAIRASRPSPSWTFLHLLRHHSPVPAYGTQATVLRPRPHLLVLCDGEVMNLTYPHDGYHCHLRWGSTAIHPPVYAIDQGCHTLHLWVSSFHGSL